MDRYYQAALVVPANTTAANPTKLPVHLENAILVDIELYVPIGHSGFTGCRVLMSNQQVLPFANLSWITVDDYFRLFEVNEEVGASAVSVQGYNTDVIQHTFYFRFHIRTIDAPTTGTLSSAIGTGIGSLTSSDLTPPAIGDASGAGTIPGLPSLPGINSLPPIPGLGGGIVNAQHAHQQAMSNDS